MAIRPYDCRRGEWPREKREERKERREYLSSFLCILFPMHPLSYASSFLFPPFHYSLFTLSSAPLLLCSSASLLPVACCLLPVPCWLADFNLNFIKNTEKILRGETGASPDYSANLRFSYGV